MSKRFDDDYQEGQSQKEVKLSSQEIEVSSNTQQTQSKVSLFFFFFIFIFIFKTMDSTLNRSIGPVFQNLFWNIRQHKSVSIFNISRLQLAGPNCRRKFGFECSRIWRSVMWTMCTWSAEVCTKSPTCTSIQEWDFTGRPQKKIWGVSCNPPESSRKWDSARDALTTSPVRKNSKSLKSTWVSLATTWRS